MLYGLKKKRKKSLSGFTLVEAILAIAIVGFMGVGLLSVLMLTRHMAELDKQRIAAIAAARDYHERSRLALFPAAFSVSNIRLDDFNTPATLDDLNATLSVKLYEISPDGSRFRELDNTYTLDYKTLVEVVISIKWNRTGRLSSHRMQEVIHTYQTADL